jgi:hypothetical protein
MKTNSKLVNVDEIGVYTVQVTNKITVAKWKNEVNFRISSERGKLMTGCVAGSAMECCAPPTFVIPRKKLMVISFSVDMYMI